MTTNLPPIDWFRDPGLTEPTPVTITSDGRIFGHIAEWNSTHIGLPGRVKPPRSRTDYRWFHRGTADVLGDDGQPQLISAGNLTCNTGHAPMTATASETDRHYDDSGTVVAKVNAGEDPFGIWFAGQLAPGLDEVTRWRVTACGLSGDWRGAEQGEYGGLELRAALFVPVTGFPIGRARVAAAGAPASPPLALVSAGMLTPAHTEEDPIVSAPTPPAPSDGPSPDGTVQIGDTGLVGRVVESTDGGDVVVEVTVSADQVHAASEQEAMAASAKLTQRQEIRSLAASVQSLTEQLAARDRADAAARLLEGVPAQQ